MVTRFVISSTGPFQHKGDVDWEQWNTEDINALFASTQCIVSTKKRKQWGFVDKIVVEGPDGTLANALQAATQTLRDRGAVAAHLPQGRFYAHLVKNKEWDVRHSK